jgi:hypothetical protein
MFSYRILPIWKWPWLLFSASVLHLVSLGIICWDTPNA